MRTLFTIAILALEVALATICPFLAKKIVTTLGVNYEWGLVFSFTALYGVFWLISKVTSDLEEIIFFPVVNESIKDITYRTIDHLHKIPLGAQKHSSSEMISMIKRISLSARSFIKVFFLQIPRAVLTLVLAAIVLLEYRYYGVWIFGVLVLSLFCLYRTIRWYADTREKAWKCTDQVTKAIHDSILFTKTARFHQNFEMSRLGKSLTDEANLWNLVNVRLHLTSAVVTVIFGFAFLAILLSMISEGVSVGDFVLIKGFLLAIFVPLRNLTRQIRLTAESVVDIQSIIEVLEIPAVSTRTQNSAQPAIKELAMVDVDFQYEGCRDLFQGLDFSFSPGEKVLIKGATGSGKSTFCHLLASLISPQKGDVTLNKKSISSYTKQELGKMLLFIPQQAHLLNATVLENLTYGFTHVSQEQVEDAIEKVGLTSTIERLTHGLYTSIGEKGNRFSGGETQKIALARALIIKPNILILDEATQSLDRQSEERALEALFANIPLIFVVSHQMEYFDQFTRILRFEKGKVFSESETKPLSFAFSGR